MATLEDEIVRELRQVIAVIQQDPTAYEISKAAYKLHELSERVKQIKPRPSPPRRS